MTYLTKKEIEMLREILKHKDTVGFPFKTKHEFDLWFDTWIGYPIKEILEKNIQRNMRSFH
jgi:hypothetical protein